jgi:mono/diheme cytochrome c family protein
VATRRLVLAGLLFATAAAQGAQPGEADELARGRAALRAMDCARCHGRDYDGWAAPSLVAAVRDSSRERFERWVLDGNIGAGMPGYRGQPLVAANLDAIYAYLRARSQGEVGPGVPGAAAR